MDVPGYKRRKMNEMNFSVAFVGQNYDRSRQNTRTETKLWGARCKIV